MKKIRHLFLAAATVVTFSVASSALGGEPLRSPCDAQLRHDFRKVATPPSDVNLAANQPLGNAKALEFTRSFRKVPIGSSVNLAPAPRPIRRLSRS